MLFMIKEIIDINNISEMLLKIRIWFFFKKRLVGLIDEDNQKVNCLQKGIRQKDEIKFNFNLICNFG